MGKTVFSFNPVTKEYVGAVQADESPLEPGEYLIPAFSTMKQPPATAEREVAVFDDGVDDWIVAPDYRSVPLYSTADGSAIAITEIGPQPVNTTELARPSIYHDWDGVAWAMNIQKAQAAIWDLIKSERDRRKAGGVKVGAKWFHSDDGSRIQQMGLVMIGAGIPANLQWKTKDGSFITMTQTLASQVFQAVAASDQAIFTAAETHRVAMEASTDPASYDYSGGWPKIYGE